MLSAPGDRLAALAGAGGVRLCEVRPRMLRSAAPFARRGAVLIRGHNVRGIAVGPGSAEQRKRAASRPGHRTFAVYTPSTKIALISLTLVSVGPVCSRSPVAAKKAVASLLSR